MKKTVRSLVLWKLIAKRKAKRERRLEQKIKELLDELEHLQNIYLSDKQLNDIMAEVNRTHPERETLQDRMRRFCELCGCEVRQKGEAIECDTPSGITVTIFQLPKIIIYGNRYENVYGLIDNHDKYGLKYLTEHQANYLFKLLGKNIAKLLNNG